MSISYDRASQAKSNQAHSGVFHMLPLGQRVMDKIERLIDKHMTSLGASRLDLSSLSSQELWTKSGRLNKINSELFLLKDRKDAGYLLSPTHEEEITTLVADSVKSYKELPVRLYQISRKYRDELRPRHGLLRSREFLMKDLYTFDITKEAALETYHAVRLAYRALFDELKVAYLVADADSGDIGGDLSHEFHFPTRVGEDNIISCTACEYVANEELAEAATSGEGSSEHASDFTFLSPNQLETSAPLPTSAFTVWRGVTRDRATLVNVWYAVSPRVHDGELVSHAEVNMHAIKNLVPDLHSGIEDPVSFWGQLQAQKSVEAEASQPMIKIVNLIDAQLPADILKSHDNTGKNLPIRPPHAPYKGGFSSSVMPNGGQSLLQIQEGDKCPRCSSGVLKIQKAIELGHTFYLGTRYSEPLGATVTIPASQKNKSEKDGASGDVIIPMQMGCHGIGVSRMIGAIAETLSDEKGLNWPRVIAPYEVMVVASKGNESAVSEVYDALQGEATSNNTRDVAIDDRSNSFAWKLNDADLVGYPVIVVIGRTWKNGRSCEVQCRRLGIRQDVEIGRLSDFVEGLLCRL